MANYFDKYDATAGNHFDKYDPPKDKPRVPYFRGMTDAALQGVTLGASDEVNAFGGAIGDYLGAKIAGREFPAFGQAYDQNLAREREGLKQFGDQNPGSSIVGNVLGGFAAAPVNAVAGAAPTLWQAMKNGAGLGAKIGAITGFNSGEDGVANRAAKAAGYGAIGGTIGFAAPPIVEGAARVGGKVWNDILAMSEPAVQAKSLILRALSRDGMTADDLANSFAGAVAEGGAKPVSLPDVGGRNMQRLARFAESVPGEATDQAAKFYGARNAEQGARIADDVAELIHPNVDFHGSLEALNAARKALAGPAYETAFTKDIGMGPGVIWSDTLEKMLQRPSMKDAVARAYRIAADEGVTLPQFTKLADDGTLQVISRPDMQTLHYVKRGLADVVQSAKEPVTGKITTDAGRASNGVLRELKDEIYRLNPEYQAATKAYAGDSANIDALEMGRRIMTRSEFSDPKAVAKAFNDLGDTEKDFFRAGVAQSIRDTLENTRDGRNAVNGFFSSPAMRERIKAIFPDEKSFLTFQARVMREADMHKVGQFVMGGSPTARIMADQADGGNLASLGMDLATGNVGGAVRRGVMDALARRWQGVTADRADALAPMLFSGDQAANSATIGGLLTFAQDRARRAAASQRNLTGLLGPLTAQPALLGSK